MLFKDVKKVGMTVFFIANVLLAVVVAVDTYKLTEVFLLSSIVLFGGFQLTLMLGLYFFKDNSDFSFWTKIVTYFYTISYLLANILLILAVPTQHNILYFLLFMALTVLGELTKDIYLTLDFKEKHNSMAKFVAASKKRKK